MKYLKLFESREESDAALLDQLVFLWKNGIVDDSSFEFEEFGDWDLELVSEFGKVGFNYDGTDSEEWDGDSWDVIMSYYRTIGDTTYRCWMKGRGRGPHDDVEVEELTEIIDLTKAKKKSKNGTT
jgi:hypothetical protein